MNINQSSEFNLFLKIKLIESKRGTFKDMMSTQEVKVRISMPKFWELKTSY